MKNLSKTNTDELLGRGEQFKALLDHIKHIATLSTGTILILFTFLQNFVKQPIARDLVMWSVSSLLLSIVSGVLLFGVLALRFPRRTASPLSEAERSFIAATLMIGWVGFSAGIGCLGVFFWKNW